MERDTAEDLSVVPLVDPKAMYEELRADTERAVLETLASGEYVLGSRVQAFEAEIASYLGTSHAVGVSSGTDALLLALESLGVGPGDEVATTCFSFFATASVIARRGARPVFVDIDPETYQMDPAGLARAITRRTRAIICVHLYGHPAPIEKYLEVSASAARPIPLIEDAAQAIGTDCRFRGRAAKAGTAGVWGCFSFYPTKNLPACGEGGLMVTPDPDLAERARHLRNQGQDAPYRHRHLGGNARLDALQAAVLRVRLPRIEAWNERRRANAALYRKLFRDAGLASTPRGVRLPPEANGVELPNYHQFTVRVERRDELREFLGKRGIQTGVYYPVPMPFQPVFESLGHRRGDFPNAEAAAREVISLPVHQYLAPRDIERVVAAVAEFRTA
ncbi:MAG: DegT/DnrJ/EryC1/StrS family aminotransferase [Planctomycetota bacterium]